MSECVWVCSGNAGVGIRGLHQGPRPLGSFVLAASNRRLAHLRAYAYAFRILSPVTANPSYFASILFTEKTLHFHWTARAENRRATV